ncbi:MAG: hypothetical protein ACK53Y_04965 [bacterium]
MPNWDLNRAMPPARLTSTGNRRRLSCPISRLTRPDAPSSPPSGTSGNACLRIRGSVASRFDAMVSNPCAISSTIWPSVRANVTL